ncbi:MAG: histidinol-phosphatase HisJ family protein [Lachnospiraceae bacterium]|jgi:histidinol-phosphatase (PHP family)
MRVDYHIHSEFSHDSTYPAEQILQDAIEAGLDEVCITDHVDYGVKDDWDCGHPFVIRGGYQMYNVNYPVYMKRLRQLQQKYAGRIALRIGMEYGVQTHTIPQYEALYDKYPLDFILLSIHQVDNLEFWTQDFQRGRTQKEYNERYYDELLQVVRRFKHYSVLAHLDLIVRYDRQGVYPFRLIEPVIREILKTVIEDGKGIELNTSSHRYHLRDTTPSVPILKLYHKLGGDIITIGSDTHRPGQIGKYSDESRELLKSLGFRYFSTFEDMTPIMHPL